MGVFLGLVLNKKIAKGSHLCIEAVDRLSREQFDESYSVISKLMKAGIILHTTEDRATYTATNYGDLAIIIPLVVKISAAHEYSKRLSMRMISAKSAAITRAREEGTPLGKQCPAWLRLSDDRSEYEVIASRAKVIRTIFDMANSGEGAPSIAARLNRERVPMFTKTGQDKTLNVTKHKDADQWGVTRITNILTSRAVIGELQPVTRRKLNMVGDDYGKEIKRGNPIPNFYPAILSLDVFNSVQQIRAQNHKGNKRRSKDGSTRIHNLFSGKLVCLKCGSSMTIVTGNLARSSYLYCLSALRYGPCDARGAIAVNKLEPHLLGRLVVMPEGFPVDSGDDEANEIDMKITEMKAEIEAGKLALTEWLAVKPTPRVMAMLADREAQLDGLENDLREAVKRLGAARPVVPSDEHLATIRALRAAFEAGDYEARLKVRTALRGLLRGIYCDTIRKACLAVLNDGQTIFIDTAKGVSFDVIDGGLRLLKSGSDALKSPMKISFADGI